MSDPKLTRRKFLELAGSGAISLPFVSTARARTRPPGEQTLYVGTYTSGKSKGIYVYRLNMSTGELKYLDTIEGVVDPSYLTIDRRTRFLYAVNEVSEFDGKPSGAVSSFAIDKNGHLKQINQKASEGGAPCYITLDRTERFVLLANYEAGNVSVLPLKRDGGLGQAVSVVQHHGSSVNPDRQKGPHAHCIVVDAFNRYAFAVDLGVDKILGYRFDARNGKLISHTDVETKPGAGPRHLTFHPNNKYAYVINELDSTITAYSYESQRGRLTPQQTISTLPAGYSGDNSCADVHVAPSGGFLYGSNRGHDSIVVFAIDLRSGRLTYVEHVSTGGKTPRNFTIDPTGRFLLAANQKSDSVVTFGIDPASGRLKPTGHSAEIPTPVCLKFVSRRA
jgi:6-phosphogluconolactonase